MSIILASTSRYRAALLTRLGVPFEVAAPGVDEAAQNHEPAAAIAKRLAREKALAVSARFPDAVVIGSDQVAICARQRLGKPGTPEAALAQLQHQRGQITEFFTAVCFVRGPEVLWEDTVTTRVFWREASLLTDAVLARYVEIEQPLDCAGAAKSEGLGLALVARIETDDPTALIGLPLISCQSALTKLGLSPLHLSA
ncbi:MAG: Maf family protein [Burkholderiaceae bacterium]